MYPSGARMPAYENLEAPSPEGREEERPGYKKVTFREYDSNIDVTTDDVEPESEETSSSDDGAETMSRCRKCCAGCRPRYVVLASCCSCCCLTLLILVAVVMRIGWKQVAMSQQRANEQDPHMTPVQFPRYSSCGGCKEGYKTDDELKACIEPCYNLSFVTTWEKFTKDNGYKLVYFPSRPGPKGEPPVNISAWWLPAPPRADGSPAPRIVVLHGLASNNNHCGVQSTCYMLRAIGFSCLAPSVRDFGLSEKSSHPAVLTWGYDYHLDLLGGWDYAVNDPDGVLGGKLPTDKVGIMGFSKGALGASIAFGIETRIPGAWLDSGPYGGLKSMIYDTVGPYLGPLAGLLAEPVFWSASYFAGGRLDTVDPLEVLAECRFPKVQRQVAISQSAIDDVVPIKYAQQAVAVLSGLPDCYKVMVYTPPEFCNGARHHQEMWEFPDDMRAKLCHFWSGTFNQDRALCRLESQPVFQKWSPSGELPPGSPSAASIA
eukprot:gb/GFBE01006822.1/.p1 GENE.gb/GFBE01006822.1/~~gb/GFBE01006822.1/.p1  ORF type:complete len:488 (+),score=58.24 gb/GFBE01006822.1/:1-1464(+)